SDVCSSDLGPTQPGDLIMSCSAIHVQIAQFRSRVVPVYGQRPLFKSAVALFGSARPGIALALRPASTISISLASTSAGSRTVGAYPNSAQAGSGRLEAQELT